MARPRTASIAKPQLDRIFLAAFAAGLVIAGDLKPNSNVLKVIRDMPFPVLLTPQSSYQVASKVHDVIVKTRASDIEKIALIRDLIAENVDVKKILNAIK